MKNSHKRIMLVEDENAVRRCARKIIEHGGYEVEDYSHGLSAFQKLVELRTLNKVDYFGLILSDVIMPEMDGLAFAEKCTEIVPNTPFLLMSGYIPRSCDIPLNVRGIISKPFNKDTLERSLNKYFSKPL